MLKEFKQESVSLNQEPIFCANCNLLLGYTYPGDLILIDSILAREIHGVCIRCHEPYHYSITDKHLRELIDKISRRNDLEGHT